MTNSAGDTPPTHGRGSTKLTSNNFAFMRVYETQFDRLGALAERYFSDDPNTCLIKLRQNEGLAVQAKLPRKADTGKWEDRRALHRMSSKLDQTLQPKLAPPA